MTFEFSRTPQYVDPSLFSRVEPTDFTNFTLLHQPESSGKKMLKDTDMCNIVLGIAVCILIIYLVVHYSGCGSSYNRSHAVSGKQASVIQNDCHAKMDFANSNVINLTHCAEGDETCKDFKKVSPDLVTKNTADIKTFATDNEDVLFMVYAPWCPHCHTTLPKFVEASKKVDKTKFALINAELCSRDLLQGDSNGIAQVTHFPYIFHKVSGNNAVFKGNPTVENLVTFSTQKKQSNLELMFS